MQSGAYTSYWDVEYEEQAEEYRNKQYVVGGLADDGYDAAAFTRQSAQITERRYIEGSSGVYGDVYEDGNITTNADAQVTSDARIKQYGSALPSRLTFKSLSTDWAPNTMMTVNLPDLGITESYYLIETVDIRDFTGDNGGTFLETAVTATQRAVADFGTHSKEDYKVFFGRLIKFAKEGGQALAQTTSIERSSRTITVGSGKDFTTIQGAIDSIKKQIDYGVSIDIYVDDGTYDEYVTIGGFTGNGGIVFWCSGSGACEISQGFAVDYCAISVIVSGFSTAEASAYDCYYVFMQDVVINSSSGTGFEATRSNMYLSTCPVNGCATAYFAATFSKLFVGNASGSTNVDVFSVTTGSVITRGDATNPTYSGALYSATDGGIIIDSSGIIYPAQ
jgi:hypothetical protein